MPPMTEAERLEAMRISGQNFRNFMKRKRLENLTWLRAKLEPLIGIRLAYSVDAKVTSLRVFVVNCVTKLGQSFLDVVGNIDCHYGISQTAFNTADKNPVLFSDSAIMFPVKGLWFAVAQILVALIPVLVFTAFVGTVAFAAFGAALMLTLFCAGVGLAALATVLCLTFGLAVGVWMCGLAVYSIVSRCHGFWVRKADKHEHGGGRRGGESKKMQNKEKQTDEKQSKETPAKEKQSKEKETEETPTEKETTKNTQVEEKQTVEKPTEEKKPNNTQVEEKQTVETPTEEKKPNNTQAEEKQTVKMLTKEKKPKNTQMTEKVHKKGESDDEEIDEEMLELILSPEDIYFGETWFNRQKKNGTLCAWMTRPPLSGPISIPRHCKPLMGRDPSRKGSATSSVTVVSPTIRSVAQLNGTEKATLKGQETVNTGPNGHISLDKQALFNSKEYCSAKDEDSDSDRDSAVSGIVSPKGVNGIVSPKGVNGIVSPKGVNGIVSPKGVKGGGPKGTRPFSEKVNQLKVSEPLAVQPPVYGY
ncbi:hypothetical protein QBC34DRAFT_427887 [Podospora aff. communis PSN243]|uniref:Transmembrane protein n=1 Tax=Podospora aff. communis PSN243 TaxID=3040156 RepID=A0AAV9GHG5_9PEZI|nr:hypothetical protein QBC34DRAFT_427887 [Podospora aff. communis PSN243]